MKDSGTTPGVIGFGVFEADLRARELRKNGVKVKVQEQPFQVLQLLLERHGEVVTKEELKERLWPGDTFVDFDLALATAVKKLRDALDDSADNPRFVETLPRRGYRFIAPVGGVRAPQPLSPQSGGTAPANEPPALAGPDVLMSGWGHRRMTYSIAVLATVLLIGGAVWFFVSRSTSNPMKVVPFTSFPGRETNPAFSPDGNQITFSWNGAREDNYDIYVKLIGPGRPLRLTSNPAADFLPVWSPDGRQIAFVRCARGPFEGECGIFLVPALGGSERKLHALRGVTQLASSNWSERLSWSPNGTHIAFSDRSKGPYGIFLLSVDGGGMKELTSPPLPSQADVGPAFSPDGNTLAFVRDESFGGGDIYLIPVLGGEPRRITFDKACLGGLAWTSDSKEIIFSSCRLGNLALWRVSASGGEPERLSVGGEGVLSPSVSRQGNRLAYVHGFPYSNVWRMEGPNGKREGSPPARFIASSQYDMSPQFSPDGNRIVFASGRSGKSEIWLCDSDGSNPVQLTFLEASVTGTPRWSPDGGEIAFDSRPQGHADIFVVSVEGGAPRRITEETSSEVIPNWSQDGRWIYFGSDRSGSWEVWKIPREGGQAVQVTRNGGFAAFETLDGRFLYYTKDFLLPGLWRMPVEGGEETQVLKDFKVSHVGWVMAKDGMYFLSSQTRTIEFFDFATERMKTYATVEKNPGSNVPGLTLSPDGRWILYTQLEEANSDIMLVENFR